MQAKGKRNKRSQAASYREYHKKWDSLVDELEQRAKEGKSTARIKARIMALNKKYSRV